jgi:hypothetical protein
MKAIHIAYKFRLKPTPEQAEQFAQVADVCLALGTLSPKRGSLITYLDLM